LAYRVLAAGDAFWRPSNQMKVENTDLAKQLEAQTLGTRLWRLHPCQASTKHKHFDMHELYVVLEGTGRIRVDDELFTLEPLSAVLVEPEHVRQIFNDTDSDALWQIVGAPREAVTSTLEMSEERLTEMYPEGPKVLPPVLGGGQFDG
jgi:mannose-6-phosphate isomerase-like protein (cupin superfamily)